MHYTIIDVETSGRTNRITEISVFKYDGNKVIDEFTSLVNPNCYIPEHITALTGIDNGTVANAPEFHEIAQQVLEITKDTIFVAHNVNFDYNVIRNEFKSINIDFTRKKLCTVRLSRKLLPGHKSYSLGKLSKDLNININGRHRARGDAEATVTLFKKLQAQDNAENVFSNFLNKNSKEATLPPNLPKEVFNALPNATGIYYFKNKKNEIIYVGKAKNIKKRVLSHFYSKAQKSLNMVRETRDIDFELSGSELIALLMEDAAIKQHFPQYNKVAKRAPKGFSLFSYQDRNNIMHIAINNSKATPNPIITFYSLREARLFLERICEQFNLCPKFCHLQEGVSECSHFSIKNCKGICKGNEDVNIYNERVTNAICEIVNDSQDKILKEKGRNDNEEAFVIIKNGTYLGYGFIDKNEQITHEDELENYLIKQKDNSDVQGILRSVLLK
ncbi:exonuclease domain-containing protein [Lacinutrix venerupis]|uniref:DNA polymerase III subunit epsilon n=1 Tax=Lacinutrix venerupis TaxID=1486034 RepID=A0AAC9LMV8_9FLAO|nr:exonuclease domain-containing protein [Lacinutrix venerupis]APY00513.1 DNA polymerase III subunit epsilon [Lacinutrix venerupis]